MSNLKAKLAQKIEDTIDNEVNTDKSSIIAESVKEDNNLIVIKPEDKVEFSYVPEFAITMNEARERINDKVHAKRIDIVSLKMIKESSILYVFYILKK